MVVMQESPNLFSSRAVLEALCLWSDSLKSFQGRIGKDFARSEARGRNTRLYPSFAMYSGTEKWRFRADDRVTGALCLYGCIVAG